MTAPMAQTASGSVQTVRAEMLMGLALAFLAQRSGLVLATAESCTGGQASALLTQLPGSSAWFEGGVVSYGNGVKEALLGVSPDLLNRHGAVSEPVAQAMATGLSERLTNRRVDLAIVAFTGIAGPGGGRPGKPVGTVVFAWKLPSVERSAQRWFAGGRAEVQAQAVWFGLSTLAGLMVQGPRS